MKRLLYVMAFFAVVTIVGFAIASITLGRSRLLGDKDFPVPTVVPTLIANIPDIEHVPFYPGASITSFGTSFNGHPAQMADMSPTDLLHRSADGFGIVYEVGDDPGEVYSFYQNVLPKKGWVLQNSKGAFSLYGWTDPAQKLPWHLYLQVTVGSTLDNSNTQVRLTYGRYPAVETGLPTYPDAHELTTVLSETMATSPPIISPIHVTDVTYLSSASPEEIASFYNNSMLEYGWIFFDRSGSGEVRTQTGNISSEEGLFFRSTRLGWDMQTITSYQLFVTAKPEKDGQSSIKLHLEEIEMHTGD